MLVSSSMIYDYVQCPHRVWRDRHGPQNERAEQTNPFMELLWERGVLYEEKVISGMGGYVDLGEGELDERIEKTLGEMGRGAPLLYQGVLKSGGLLGVPDLLRRLPGGGYIPIDIKSGMGLEGIDDNIGSGKMKKHYAVQLCLYSEILGMLGFSDRAEGVILDIRGEEVIYDLLSPAGRKAGYSWRDVYLDAVEEIRSLLSGEKSNEPALAGACKLCHWYSSCKKWCERTDDLSRIFYLGREKRDRINRELGVGSVKDFADIDVGKVLERKKQDKSCLKGMGEKTITRAAARAKLLSEGGAPRVYGRLELPEAPVEFFFDIEDDPTQDFVYLHGLYKREGGEEKYIYFFAVENTPEQEKTAWSEFWDFLRKYDIENCAVYYYSSHEKTVYRKLRAKYPDVVSENELESFFGHPNVVDLYSKVLKHTDWPLSSYSVKDIAGYLGFNWRDKSPSGALSIKWFNDYLRADEPGIFKRIIEYNEDDCRATMVLKDGLAGLSQKSG